MLRLSALATQSITIYEAIFLSPKKIASTSLKVCFISYFFSPLNCISKLIFDLSLDEFDELIHLEEKSITRRMQRFEFLLVFYL